MKFKTIKCPFCEKEHAHITYEENRVYMLNCTECHNAIFHRDHSWDSAVRFFEKLLIVEERKEMLMVDHYISLERAVKRMYAVTEEFGTQHIFIDRIVDELENIPSCPISTPAVPGPSESDPNIMELCFHNGERHMKEKVGKELARLAEHMPCITLAQALAMLEGL